MKEMKGGVQVMRIGRMGRPVQEVVEERVFESYKSNTRKGQGDMS